MVTGETLREARKAAELGLTSIAARAECTPGHLSRVERGERDATPKIILAYEQATGSKIAATAPARDAPILDAMRRRLLLERAAKAAVGGLAVGSLLALFDGLPAVATPQLVGEPEILNVESATDWLTGLDLSRGGGVAASMAQGALRYAVGCCHGETTDASRLRLHAALAGLADRVAWSHYDAGNWASAEELFVLALSEAAKSPDRDLRAHVALNLSTLTFDRGDRAEAVEILRMAIGDDRVGPVEAANLHTVCARHLGGIDDRQAALRHLGMAQDALGCADTGNAPPWATRVTASPGHFASALGLARYALGDHDEARQHFTDALKVLGPGRARTVVRCRTRLATIDLAAGELTTGEQHARQVIVDAAGMRSARVLADVRMVQSAARARGLTQLDRDLAAVSA